MEFQKKYSKYVVKEILLSQKDIGNVEMLKLYPIYMLPFIIEDLWLVLCLLGIKVCCNSQPQPQLLVSKRFGEEIPPAPPLRKGVLKTLQRVQFIFDNLAKQQKVKPEGHTLSAKS